MKPNSGRLSQSTKQLKDIVVKVIADYNGITIEEATNRYEAWAAEHKARKEREKQEKMSMEYGP